MKPPNILTPALILTIICLVLFILWMRASAKLELQKRLMDNIAWDGKLQAEKKISASLQDSIVTLTESFSNKAKKDSVELKKKNDGIKALAKTVAVLRGEAQDEIDSLPDVARFVYAYDSLNAAKDEFIVDMSLRHSAQVADLQEIIEFQTKSNMAKEGIISILEHRNQELEKDVRKAHRGKRFWRVMTGVAAAGIVYVSLKSD